MNFADNTDKGSILKKLKSDAEVYILTYHYERCCQQTNYISKADIDVVPVILRKRKISNLSDLNSDV